MISPLIPQSIEYTAIAGDVEHRKQLLAYVEAALAIPERFLCLCELLTRKEVDS
jgi:hypothetical protein